LFCEYSSLNLSPPQIFAGTKSPAPNQKRSTNQLL
jgi:hypothetical protein